MKTKKILILDAGHRLQHPGACYGGINERSLVREIANIVYQKLSPYAQQDLLRIVRLDDESEFNASSSVDLFKRVVTANRIENNHMMDNLLLVSIHLNASDNHDASGFEAYVCKNASSASRSVAEKLVGTAIARGFGGNRKRPQTLYREENFAIIAKTKSPAVLTESLFLSNESDREKLQSPSVLCQIADIHVDVIRDFFQLPVLS